MGVVGGLTRLRADFRWKRPDAALRSLTSSRGHAAHREPGDGAAGFGQEPWRGWGPFALWVVTKPARPLPRAFTTLCYSADGQSILAGGMSKFVCIYHVREQILRKKFEISCNLSLDAMEVSELRGCCRAPGIPGWDPPAPWSPEMSGFTWRSPYTLAPQATWGPSRKVCLPGFMRPGPCAR